MIDRYTDVMIARIWRDEEKLAVWQDIELVVLAAKVLQGSIPKEVSAGIKLKLEATPVDIAWWKAREKETKHDLQAWIEERVRHLPIELRPYFHEGMTSYDTEETAFLILLHRSANRVIEAAGALENALKALALRYRYCPMMGMTHGQHAEVQTFGKRALTWYQEISLAKRRIKAEADALHLSKLSGAIGNYGGLTPAVEEKALDILGFKPFHGATQILPRQLHAPLAQSLVALVAVISKIGTDIRLGARSPRPIYQEPFGKSQTGSSRMPQKKNTISSEQLEGMERMALGYLVMIMQNIRTWEERAIEQSCVERVAWPDLFHVAMRSLTVCLKIMEDFQVYPDNMMQDIIDTRGTWAAGPAKEFLREKLVEHNITTEDAYRIVQLASFIAFEPHGKAVDLRLNQFGSLTQAGEILEDMEMDGKSAATPIKEIIARGKLKLVSALDISPEQIDEWNRILEVFFDDDSKRDAWNKVFSLNTRLEDEKHLFKQVFGA